MRLFIIINFITLSIAHASCFDPKGPLYNPLSFLDSFTFEDTNEKDESHNDNESYSDNEYYNDRDDYYAKEDKLDSIVHDLSNGLVTVICDYDNFGNYYCKEI